MGSSPVSCFNPLHCGAVVASKARGARIRRRRRVSIPFIAGQWSLHVLEQDPDLQAVRFQSPSLRGSGRFGRPSSPRPSPAMVSIPFIAGQWSLPPERAQRLERQLEFQSPSLRGSGRFQPPRRRAGRKGGKFQSPSLRGSGRFRSRRRLAGGGARGFQSPSLRGSGRFRGRRPHTRPPRRCFNPLHCGAVVASASPPTSRCPPVKVSIPFIAGQWSLLTTLSWRTSKPIKFQSPSLRGSGRFRSVCNSALPAEGVSIPFIAGQWSLPYGGGRGASGVAPFQSPSLRGSGRFLVWGYPFEINLIVSIPFIAGQWSLLAV